jgi:hypothetical protein
VVSLLPKWNLPATAPGRPKPARGEIVSSPSLYDDFNRFLG